MKFFSLVFITIFLMPLHYGESQAATTRIGNGDEGSDLEGFEEVKGKSPLAVSQKKAVLLLKSLNISGVPGLGTLLPEVESTKLFITKKDSVPIQPSDQNAFHADMKGRVYARTFAEPHATTRFFPVATKLDDDQLIALQIHEGLHRSLPESVRENESVVSEITLAITAPGANFDSVAALTHRLIPELHQPEKANGDDESKITAPASSRIHHPSLFSYEYRRYRNPNDDSISYPINAMHVISSELYPFDIAHAPVGLGIKLSLINRPSITLMGPLELSGNIRLFSSRGFDVGFFADAALNTLSNDELKESQFGRDAYTLGLSLKKDLQFFSIENDVSYLFPSASTKKIGLVNYEYNYGSVVSVATHPAILWGAFRIGGFLEFLLGDYFRVSGGAFSDDSGKYRILSAGPEIEYHLEQMIFGLSARYLINSTKDASFDTLGNLMGTGVAQGSLNAKFSIQF